MDARIRNRLIVAGSLVLALFVGSQIANGSFGFAATLAAFALLFLINRAFGLAAEVWVTGAVIVGYLVGNRGFAQLHPPTLPLLPAEGALALAVVIGAWRWAFERRVPFQRDTLNWILLAWIVVASVRLPFDFRASGFMAIRDFAMVYYAFFFYLAQDWAADVHNRRFLERCLVIGLALTTPAFWAFTLWPAWFESHLVIAGAPLIYVKSDVAGGFMAGAVFVFVDRYIRNHRLMWLVLAGVSLLGVATSNSRAAAMAVVGGALWLLLARQWKALRAIGLLGAIGVLMLTVQAAATSRPFTTTPLYRAYEAGASVLDFSGTRRYQSAELGDKPDNNQFRLVWWRTVIDETWRDGRWLGLGFGRDLAEDFLRIYSPEGDEQFSARSPHNFLLSTFARTGLVGLAALFGVMVCVLTRTWRAMRRSRNSHEPVGAGSAYWLLAWSIFISACFGVVLEGPMAAVVFWTSLGLANAETLPATRSREIAPTEANATDAIVV